MSDGDRMTTKTSLSGGRKTEEQRRLVAMTAVVVVSRLALEIGRVDVSHLAYNLEFLTPGLSQIIHLSISLLLQRLRGVDLVTESTIVTNLVPLALAGSNHDLVEVSRAFSQISRSSHPEDPRMSSNAVLAAQTNLAKGLCTRLDCADGYLVELLTLFADKGTQTQMIAVAPTGFDTHDKEKLTHLRSDSEARVTDMKAWLAALLIPISTLLSHPSYHPDQSASAELVAHFRNLWFLCVVFGLSGQAGRKQISEHEANALGIIAEKTPPLVLESAVDYVASDLEYNSILRKDFAASVRISRSTIKAQRLHRFSRSSGPPLQNCCQTSGTHSTYETYRPHRPPY
jgi:phosphatidylinositol 4-kinase